MCVVRKSPGITLFTDFQNFITFVYGGETLQMINEHYRQGEERGQCMRFAHVTGA